MPTKNTIFSLPLMALTVLCMLCVGVSQAQRNAKFNSYSRVETNPTTVYLDSAQYLSDKSPFRAIDLVNKAVGLCIKENDIGNEALAYLILGNIQQQLKQDELAIENFKKCIQTLSSVGNYKKKSKKEAFSSNETSGITLFNAYRQLATSLMATGDYAAAKEAVEVCLDRSRFADVPVQQKLGAKRVLAAIQGQQGNLAEGVKLLQEVLSLEKSLKNSQGEAETLLALGDLFLQQNDNTKAQNYYYQAKSLAEANDYKKLLLLTNEKLAAIFRKQKEVDKEVELRNSNIAINSSANNTQGVLQQNTQIGNAYLATNQLDKAAEYYDLNASKLSIAKTILPYDDTKSTDLFEKSKLMDENARAYRTLAEDYIKQGETTKGLEYLHKYAVLEDSVQEVRKRELNDAINLSNTIGKNQQRVELLEKERQLDEKSIAILKQDKELRQDELTVRNSVIAAMSLFIVVLLFGGYFMFRNAREKRKVNQLLAIKSLRGQMNPHFIFNALNSVNHYISQNDERSANKYLSDFSKLMRSVMDSSKHDLISLSEEIDILKLYLQLEHARFSDKFSYTFEVDEAIDGSVFELPPMMIQPYIENAVWHGLRYLNEPGKLEIRFTQNQQALEVWIRDNGIGRKKSKEIKTRNQKTQASVGMQNIEQRITIMNELYGSRIQVDVADAYPDKEDTGTLVKISIPKKIEDHA